MKYQIKKIEGFPGYFVDTNGDVFGPGKRMTAKVKGPLHKLSPGHGTYGRLSVTLHKDGKPYTRRIHQLVAKAFIPNPENKPFVCHRNGDPTKNIVEELYWGTPVENVADMIKHGTMPRGEERPNSKLSQWQVLRMRLLAEVRPDFSHRKIGGIYKVAQQTVSKILRRKTWKHI